MSLNQSQAPSNFICWGSLGASWPNPVDTLDGFARRLFSCLICVPALSRCASTAPTSTYPAQSEPVRARVVGRWSMEKKWKKIAI